MSTKNNPTNDYQKIKNELVVDRVDEIFRNHPDQYIQKMEGIGFVYHEEDDLEQIEEDNAVPENKRQEYLNAYFKDEIELSEQVLTVYLEERESDNPNYALIRRYFKKTNDRLKALLLCGLDEYPTNINLLMDLAYFHEFCHILDELVTRFTSACRLEQDMMKFGELIQEFYYATEPDGYDALSRLKELFPPDMEKGGIVAFFSQELMKQSDETNGIEF